MPPKRKHEGEPTARERKKQKMTIARTIAVQTVTVTDPGNAVASTSSSTTNSMKGLPSAIDVEKFTEARAFEINAMQTAMKAASASSTHRAWQHLPRHLRRRAASHDVRRVPVRLREKARAEMDPVRKKALGRSMPKLGKNRRIGRTEMFLKRQRDKRWLETHIWHAKRMKMENMWGYRLAIHPTEKAFRPSHRASVHGSILHDASYYSFIEFKGSESILKTILEICCDPQGQGPGAKRFLRGSRCFKTHLYRPGSYPFDFIAPVVIIWKPLPVHSPVDNLASTTPPNVQKSDKPAPDDSQDTGLRRRKRKGKEKEKEKEQNGATTTHVNYAGISGPRVVWLRCHPVVFDDVFSALQAAASLTLDATRRSGGSSEIDVEIADLRGQINVFEIMGPKSCQVLKGALSPVSQDLRADFVKFWSSLTNLQTSGSVPRGMVIGFKVNDPRLKFPPKNATPKPPGSANVAPGMAVFPTSALAQSELWDESTRRGIFKPHYKKKDLDERRSKNLIPGTPLNPLRQDDRIPVLLIQRSLERSGSDSEALHGWTLMIPAGWSMAFFNSLIFTGTRVGGQRERQTQAFEAGVPYFPRDYPSSNAYNLYAEEKEKEERGTWERKPPAKRPNYEKLGTKSPWRADWEVLLGLRISDSSFQGEEDSEGFITTQREKSTDMVVDENILRPWLLRGDEVLSILSRVSKLFNQGAGLLEEMNRLRLKRGQEPCSPSIKADELLKTALVSVKVMICARGTPEDLAIIYSIGDEEAKQWENALRKRETSNGGILDEETLEEIELSKITTSEANIIGYVTSGHFSLSRGKGFALATISVVQFLELQQQSHRLYPTKNSETSPLLVKIRNRNGQQCRAAYLEILGL